jgi:hypothetical protein
MLACLGLSSVAMRGQAAPVYPLQGPITPLMVTDPSVRTVTPDNHTLTGGQVPGIGSWGLKYSFFTPSLLASETLDSNPLLLSNDKGSYRGFTDFAAGLQWMQNLGRNSEIRYSGEMRYDSRARVDGYDQFANAHFAAFSTKIPFRTWNLLIDDEAQYSQGSNFGAAGMEGLGSINFQASQLNISSSLQLPSSALRHDLTPDQSILTGRAGRVANTALIELDAPLNGRSTATLSASYGLLHFDTSSLTDTSQAVVLAGFNRAITARDSLALEGAYNRFLYFGSDVSLSTQYLSLLYGRRVSGRSSIEFGGGPQFTQWHIPHEDQSYLGWQARAAVKYQTNRVSLSAEASRGVSSGSGVLDGSIQSIGRGMLGFDLSRFWTMSLSAGASHNAQLSPAQTIDGQFGEFTLNRRIGRFTSLFVTYDFQHQVTGTSCVGPICAYGGLRNVIGIGLAWTYRPIYVR